MSQDVNISMTHYRYYDPQSEAGAEYSEIDAKVGGQTDMFGMAIPTWASSAFKVGSFVYSMYAAHKEEQYRASVINYLRAIYDKLLQIEGRIEDLHDKVDVIYKEIKALQILILDVPQNEALLESEGVLRAWLGGINWTDAEILENYRNVEYRLNQMVSAHRSGWTSANIPRILLVIKFCLSHLSRYAKLAAKEQDGADSDRLAQEIFVNRIGLLEDNIARLSEGLKANIELAEKKFVEAWNAGNPGADFGLGPSDRTLTADWDNKTKLKKIARRGFLGSNEFLRRLNYMGGRYANLHFNALSREAFVPDRRNHFGLYHYLKFDDNTGLFRQVSPLLIFPEVGVDLNPRIGGEASDLPSFLPKDKDSMPMRDWAKTFTFAAARKDNKRFNRRMTRHEVDMERSLQAINGAWQKVILLNSHVPLIVLALEMIRAVNYENDPTV